MKTIITILASIILTSCSIKESDEITNDKLVVTTNFENALPAKLIGSYGTNRVDAEPGTLTITKDSLITDTENHRHAFKISEHFNYYDPGCGWYIRVNDITYMLTTNSFETDKSVWFKFIRKSETKFKGIGVYYKDYKQEKPIINN